MDHDRIQVGDSVEVLPTSQPPYGQPAAPRHYATVVAITLETQRATVRLPGRHYPLEVPLHQLRREAQ